MDTTELVKHAINKSADEFQSKFADIMNDKVAAAIEQKYSAMFGAPQETDEVELEPDVDLGTEQDYEGE